MAAPLTEAAIEKVRELIRGGDLQPGQRLPAEAALSAQLGVSRSSLREAVRALATAGVLDVKRGDGTFVTSLTPEQLFTGIGEAVDLMQEESMLELMECRRVVEPQVTALAAMRCEPEDLAVVLRHLQLMEAATDEQDLIAHDADFHAAVATASGNAALAAILRGISGVTLRARAWRALTEADSARHTIDEHRAIYDALHDGDAYRAEAAALLHVANVEAWMRQTLVEKRRQDA
ncbi:FadR/GntR family transcriptional regulator [Quadrisphaera setariae]|uniref:FadR family transcriptional regulator n=1 Tax=Quadrisphaera setariae TaxID=2593304 RepID=A0A5C8ZHX1_9ACTN|nr:FadR/GntR family transcriptional regulator [Quadrisphaera setariae]TXR56516.1 FadR family transcriptional regulator [Quadrisphaera setariae]